MKYYVYILYAEAHDKYYIGQTQDVAARLKRHNDGIETYSKKFAPWILIWCTEKSTRSESVILESKLKIFQKKEFELSLRNTLNRVNSNAYDPKDVSMLTEASASCFPD
ncbi:MAG: GIY-YIG nuclease family protein [Saprospiraceae bacterium]|nr:GIY-YIG nuclease family protein [Saprospiraceae bacterium]